MFFTGALPAGALRKMDSGTYVGDASADRAIPHTLGYPPNEIWIFREGGQGCHNMSQNQMRWVDGSELVTTSTYTSTNFYLPAASANAAGTNYIWFAIAEVG